MALVIGNGAYASSPLKNPVNDATDLASALKDLGFAVTLLPNATRETMEKAIRDFGTSLRSGGTGLFYYAGHGVQVKGRNYLIPIGADIQEADEVSYRAVDADLVLAQMESAGNGTNIVILDACRNNPFPGADRAIGDRGLAIVGVQPSGSYIIYATQPNATAQDGSGRNGVFTKYLLANLKTPGLDVDLMARRAGASRYGPSPQG
ncbi:MAG: caspase family protein, partial [Spirochaetota bacterium]